MARFLPVTNEGARHPLRRSLPPPPLHANANPRSQAHEDVAFFLVSFACAFIILYGFII
jgi:hypothetical protein